MSTPPYSPLLTASKAPIVVTGGAGFIGSALVRHLNDIGETHIVVVDDCGTGLKWKNLRNKRIATIVGIDALEEYLEDVALFSDSPKQKPKAIFHMGACSSTTETDMDFLNRNNVLYSQMLFRFCCEHDIPFIYASSAATYGARESGFSDEHSEVKAPLLPINPYGYSKQLFDHWLLQQEHTPPFWAGLKFFNVYGPNEYHKGGQASVIYHAFNQIQQTGEVKLFESHRSDYEHGLQLRDFVYVKDVVAVCSHLLHDDKAKSGIYNVGTGTARSFKDLALAVFAALGKEPKISYIPMPENLRDQYQYYTQADMTKLRKKGKYKAEFMSLEAGAKDYVQHHLTAEDPYY